MRPSRHRLLMILAGLAVTGVFAFVIQTGAGKAGVPVVPVFDGNGGFMRTCILAPQGRVRACFIRRLLTEIEKSHDPANELPRIDRRVREAGGYVQSNCHMMMHVVGREYARRNHVTLANLQRNLPRSNDPGCSAGFGMGLVMALGGEIGRLGPDGALKICERAPTRFRSYTCIHSLGHAYMRLYHSQLPFAIKACRMLPANAAPDCAQGAYHDYWFSAVGIDGTKRQRGGAASARSLCGRQIHDFVRPCWFRYFLEIPPKHLPTNAADVRALCHGLAGIQRVGCISAASLITTADPFRQLTICGRLKGADVVSCLYGISVQNLADAKGARRVALIDRCGRLTPTARTACYEWLGTGLTVVTNGRFRERGCPFMAPAGRSLCLAGAERTNQALVTFS
jgi:hypothetical protein